MKLFSQMEGYKIRSKLGDDMGKLEDLIIDSSTWKVKGLIVAEGLLVKNRSLVKPFDIKLDHDVEQILLSPEAKTEEITQEKSSIHYLYLSDLMKKHVITSDDDKIGKIYDIEIATELNEWKVWKLLIKVGFKQRRLRVRPENISKLGEDVRIGMTKEEVENLSHPMLG